MFVLHSDIKKWQNTKELSSVCKCSIFESIHRSKHSPDLATKSDRPSPDRSCLSSVLLCMFFYFKVVQYSLRNDCWWYLWVCVCVVNGNQVWVTICFPSGLRHMLSASWCTSQQRRRCFSGKVSTMTFLSLTSYLLLTNGLSRYWNRPLNPRKLMDVSYPGQFQGMSTQRAVKFNRLPEVKLCCHPQELTR